MSSVEIVKRHPVIAYFVLACVLTWWMFPLLQFSPLLGLFGLFGPALAAIIMAAVLAAGLVSRPYVQRRASSPEVWRNGAEKAPEVRLSCCHCCSQPGHDHLRPLAGQLA